MISKKLFMLIFLFTGILSNAQGPYGIFVDFDQTEKVKKQIQKKDKIFLPAYNALTEKADNALNDGPFSVMDKKRTPPSGDKHDYLSGGPYWWPDPSKPDGLPYIRRDGEVNPEMRGENVDPPAKDKMMTNVELLGWAYYFSGNKKYADKAIELLEVWFVNPETRMNPNLNYAQGIPGRVEGRGIGIIDWAGINKIISPIEIFLNDDLFSANTKNALLKWFEDYYTWLHTHQYGIDEDKYFNNHGTWFDVQAVSIAILLEKNEEAKNRLELKTRERIASQIEPDGSQPHELARTKSLSYSTMNLRGFYHLANMGEKLGVDLWNYRTEDGRGILQAYDFLYPYVYGSKKWEYPQITSLESTLESLKLNFHVAALKTGNNYYQKVAQKKSGPATELEYLLYPLFPKKKPNILFIAVDDLRPEINCYGATHMHTPNIDLLAERGIIFERAYCQQAVCAPSRNSLLTGLRPDATGIYDLYTFFRKKVPDVVTLPQHFKNNGYHTEAMGKIYHTGHGNSDDKLSWSVPKWNQSKEIRKLEKISRGDTVGLERDFPTIDGKKLPYYCSPMPEKNMTDAMISAQAVKRIGELKDSAFFLAVGFIKPHLPFVAPKKYWDLYDPKKIKIPERKIPKDMPEIALHQFGELRKYHGIPATGTLDDETSRNLIHGYYAAVSMIDAQVGKLLNALDENGLTDNTIIVLWGDHGWKLGDYGSWCKHTNFEMDTNTPLIFSVPWMEEKGVKTPSLAEFVDIYPTLCELADLEQPDHLEGQSLAIIMEVPFVEVNKVAISQYPRGKSLGYDRKNEIMGYSIRYENYRFTRWQKYENPQEVVATELYDVSESKAPGANLANKRKYANKLKELNALLSEELSKYKILKSD